MCDLKADEQKAKNMPKYAECVDTDIKMRCQNQERKNQSRDRNGDGEKDSQIIEKGMMGRGGVRAINRTQAKKRSR